MSEQTIDRRTLLWLDLGPTAAPAEAVEAILTAIETVPQVRPPIRLAGRSTGVTRRQLVAIAAAVAVAVAAAGAYILRDQGPDVANPRQPGDLLYDFPEATTFLERSGGPATSEERIAIGGLPRDRTFVIAASCTGDGVVAIDVFNPPSIQARPSGGGGAPASPPITRLDVACDGTTRTVNVNTGNVANDDPFPLEVIASAGTTWRVAVGDYVRSAAPPTFPEPSASEGWYLFGHAFPDTGSDIALDHPGISLAVQVPADAERVAVLVRCSGGDVTLTTVPEVVGPSVVPCDDPSRISRVEVPADVPGLQVFAGADRPTWVQLFSEALGPTSRARPAAPPLPPEIAAVAYADTTGTFIAFGTIGSNTQTLVPAIGALAGIAGGDLVGVATRGQDGTRVDLWSIAEASLLRTVATIPTSANHGQIWVDATNGHLFYEVFNDDFSTEWHRVGIDDGDDQTIAVAPAGHHLAYATLAIDDSAFVAIWCPPPGVPCRQVVFDTVTGTADEIDVGGDRPCALIGVLERSVVARTAPTCDTSERQQVTVRDLDGGPARVLVDAIDAGESELLATVVQGTSGGQLLYAFVREAGAVYSVVGLDGDGRRDLATIDPDLGSAPRPSGVRMPQGDWVLLAWARLADDLAYPADQRPAPLLLNVRTGEQIELVNLPRSIPS